MTERVQMVGDPARPTRLVEDPADIDEPKLSFFLSYWRTKRGQSTLPLRSSFAPRDVRSNLSWVVVIDALPEYTDFRYRVVGTRVADYFLGDGTGKTVRQAFGGVNSELVEGTLRIYRHTCVERIPIRLSGPATVHKNIYFPKYDSLYLPYSSDGENADRLLSIFTFNPQKLVATRSAELLHSV